MFGGASFGEEAQLHHARRNVRDVAFGFEPVGQRCGLGESLLCPSELGESGHYAGAHLSRDLRDASPLAEGDRLLLCVECGLWPLVGPDDVGEVAVDDAGLASQALFEGELERPAHVYEAVGFSETAAGEAAPVERECLLRQAELRGERE